MARCKLTRMSLRNIRKDKQYQCIVIDFVRTGVISKSKAEELLNYTIPAGLLEGSVAAPDDDEDEPGTGGETGGESGGESGSVTLAVNLGDMNDMLSGGITPKGGNRAVKAMPGNIDGWLFVNFPLPEDPEDRWLVNDTGKEVSYNDDLLSSMYDAIKDAVVTDGSYTAENFEVYLGRTSIGVNPSVPQPVVANEDYQIGEDNWNSRFITAGLPPLELTDGLIFSYTALTSGGMVNPGNPM